MRAAPSRFVPALLLIVLSFAGCGAEKTVVPVRDVEPGERTKRKEYPRAGITAELPADRPAVRRAAPGVFRVPFANSVVAAYAYPRDEQLPKEKAELETARKRLVAEIRRRDKDFDVQRVGTTKVDGAPALDLRGVQTVSRTRALTRSVHVYKGRAEYVFELLAPRDGYRRVDRYVFQPMLDSLELTGRVKKKRD